MKGTCCNYRCLCVTVWSLSQLTQSGFLALTLVFKRSVILPLCYKTSIIKVKYSSFMTFNNLTIWREYNPTHGYIFSGLQTGRGDNSVLTGLFISLMLLLLTVSLWIILAQTPSKFTLQSKSNLISFQPWRIRLPQPFLNPSNFLKYFFNELFGKSAATWKHLLNSIKYKQLEVLQEKGCTMTL